MSGESSAYGAKRGRMLGGMFANGFAIIARIGAQFVTIPILFAAWSTEQVGLWLMIAAIPSYLALVANGFAAAGGNAAIAAEGEGDRDGARATFRATWLIVSATNLIFVLIFALSSAWLVESGLVAAPRVPGAQVREALAWLCAYVVLVVQSSVLEVPFRHGGTYPRAIMLSSMASLAEIAATAVVVLSTDNLAMLPAAFTLVRLASLGIVAVLAWRASPDLFRRPSQASVRARLASLWAPSLGFMAAPVVFGFNLQGYTLLVGSMLGPVVLAAFVATRTIVRLLDILCNMAFQVLFYELPYLAKEGVELHKRLVATATTAMGGLSLVFLAGLLLLGDPVQRIWTLGATSFDWRIGLALGLAAAIRAVSISPAAILSAANRNVHFMAVYVTVSAAAFGVALLAARNGAPLWQVASFLVIAELGQAVPVYAQVARLLGYSPLALLKDTVDLPARLRDVHDLRRHLLRG